MIFTLGELKDAVEAAIKVYGDDSELVVIAGNDVFQMNEMEHWVEVPILRCQVHPAQRKVIPANKKG